MNTSDAPLIRVKDLSVRYCRGLFRSLLYAAGDCARELVARGAPGPGLRAGEFWALRDVTFELRRGECLGVIGANGAGKSTLLKVLNGLFKPDAGTITTRGRVGALIELGTGFSPVLSGRENVFINGAVLGIPRSEIVRRFERIVDFSEIGDAIDAPVRTYSTGMALRLAFAIALEMDLDVLLLDEILAVGDVGFRAKCHRAMEERLADSAVIFVSHSMPQVARLCTRLLVLDKGRIAYHGPDIPAGIECYYNHFPFEGDDRARAAGWSLESIALEPHPPQGITCHAPRLSPGDGLRIDATVRFERAFRRLALSVLFSDRETRGVAQCNPAGTLRAEDLVADRVSFQIAVPRLPLNPGSYAVSLVAMDEETGRFFGTLQHAAQFRIDGDRFGFTPVQLDGSLALDGQHATC